LKMEGMKMISEKALRKWRKEALEMKDIVSSGYSNLNPLRFEWSNRILKLTQELMDQHLLEKKEGKKNVQD